MNSSAGARLHILTLSACREHPEMCVVQFFLNSVTPHIGEQVLSLHRHALLCRCCCSSLQWGERRDRITGNDGAAGCVRGCVYLICRGGGSENGDQKGREVLCLIFLPIQRFPEELQRENAPSAVPDMTV
ncbi:MAG: hypothetical protein MZV70_16910 [Desulfobacterales bacterium]|nr:hypothetical protein [Desulfobacterales bacterium]